MFSKKRLPTWDEMTDIDKSLALRHVYRTSWNYTKPSDYPCYYRDNEVLKSLSDKARSKHAHKVTGGMKNIQKMDKTVYRQLFDLTLRDPR